MFPYLNVFGAEISVYFLLLSLIFTLIVPAIMVRAKKLDFSQIQALDLYLFVLMGAFVGSRGMYVLYQEPSFYWNDPKQILFFWNGGYIFFGGFLGALLTGFIFCRLKNIKTEVWLNFSIPLLSLGYSVGRLSCFLSGCCYGEVLNAWWAVFMHQAYRHPTALYASLMEIVIFGFLLFIEKRKSFKAMLVFPSWMVLHGLGRIVMEHFRADPRGSEIFGMSVSTIISIVLIAVCAVILIKKLKRKLGPV